MHKLILPRSCYVIVIVTWREHYLATCFLSNVVVYDGAPAEARRRFSFRTENSQRNLAGILRNFSDPQNKRLKNVRGNFGAFFVRTFVRSSKIIICAKVRSADVPPSCMGAISEDARRPRKSTRSSHPKITRKLPFP